MVAHAPKRITDELIRYEKLQLLEKKWNGQLSRVMDGQGPVLWHVEPSN